ncbi:MAG: hypothetical protein AAF805_10315 [Planctomycetota bacterium]
MSPAGTSATKVARVALAALLVAAFTLVLAAPAEAGPKWRLRRWSSRPPIDPTIRTTPRFESSRSYHSPRRGGSSTVLRYHGWR